MVYSRCDEPQKFTGHVEQISPAAGSEFSVLKPDNATGNFTKVVQRIAVRITIDPNQEGMEHLRPRYVSDYFCRHKLLISF